MTWHGLDYIILFLYLDICQNSGVSTQGGCLELETGGKPLKVTLGKVQARKRKYTTDDLIRLQTSRNFSDNDMRFNFWF